jgi:4a-hydroxytetrahydrobiopterin dehydratase
MTQEQIEAALRDLPQWTLRDGAIRRSVKLDDFVSAFGFMSSMALVSEALNHHPEWSNVYNRVEIALNTHDAKGITTLDLEWARRAEKLLEK